MENIDDDPDVLTEPREYEEVQVVVEGPAEAVPRRFWICSECSGLIAGADAALTHRRHDAFHEGKMRHDM
jgi:hypothetical protein